MEPIPAESREPSFALLYPELRRLATRLMRRERSGHTLQATAVVHEAYLRMVDPSLVEWKGRTHFFATAALCMRQLLREHARNRGRLKRGGGWKRVTFHESGIWEHPHDLEVETLDQLLSELAEAYPRKAQIVEMKFFAGLTHKEIAHVMQVTDRTVERDWRFARAWLRIRLKEL